MKNKIEDLRNHLFEELERLSDEEIFNNDKALEKELGRAKAIANISNVIVNSAKVETDFIKATGGRVVATQFFPPPSNFQIESKNNSDEQMKIAQ